MTPVVSDQSQSLTDPQGTATPGPTGASTRNQNRWTRPSSARRTEARPVRRCSGNSTENKGQRRGHSSQGERQHIYDETESEEVIRDAQHPSDRSFREHTINPKPTPVKNDLQAQNFLCPRDLHMRHHGEVKQIPYGMV